MRERRVGLLLLAPLLAALAFSYARLLFSLDDVPHDDDYRAARTLLEQQQFRQGDDALAILPPWSLRPLIVIGDLEPISGDALAEQPLHRYARLFVIVEPGAEDAVDDLRARRGAPAWSAAAGRVRVERYDLPGPRATYDFTARVASSAFERGRRAALGERDDDTPEPPLDVNVNIDGAPCTRVLRGGLGCGDGKEPWQRVTREWLLVSENADLAVWSHPPPKGSKLTIEFASVPIGSQIVVRAGHTRDGADRAEGTVKLTVMIDGERVDTVARKPRFSFDTDVVDTRKWSGRTSTVAFVVETDDSGGNHYAWDAYVVGGTTAAPVGGAGAPPPATAPASGALEDSSGRPAAAPPRLDALDGGPP